MTTFEESNLRFQFGEQWVVKQYDKHPLYLSMSGLGMSAVDFVGVFDLQTIFLIEIKNYKNRPAAQLKRTSDKLQGSLAIAFENKINKTLHGIGLIGIYLSRKWWYKFWFFCLNRDRYRRKLLHFDYLFWMFVAQQIQNPRQVNVVLWLELPLQLEDQRKQVAARVQQLLGNHFQQVLTTNTAMDLPNVAAILV